MQLLLQNVARNVLLEARITIRSNTENTVTITLEDPRAGVEPIFRNVNYTPEIGPPVYCTNAVLATINRAISIIPNIMQTNAVDIAPDLSRIRETVENPAFNFVQEVSTLNVSWRQNAGNVSSLSPAVPEAQENTAKDAIKSPGEQLLDDRENVGTAPSLALSVADAEPAKLEEEAENKAEGVNKGPASKEGDWTPEEREIAHRPEPRPFRYKKDGDTCSTCNVIKCPNCPFLHEIGRCFATGKECHYCEGSDHYVQKCPKRRAAEWKHKPGRY